MVLTADIHAALPASLQQHLEVLGRVGGWNYPGTGRGAEVVVARKIFDDR
jgi:hypothetical protein